MQIMNYLIKFLIFIILLITLASTGHAQIINKILFTVNDKVYTLVDFEIRNNYLKIINNNIDIKKNITEFQNIILYSEEFKAKEYFLNKKEINDMYLKIINNYKANNTNIELKEIFLSLSTEDILKNIEYDYNKKIILEEFLNDKKNIIFSKDLSQIMNLYDINIKYYSFDIITVNQLKKIVNTLSFYEINSKLNELNQYNILYIYNEKKIINTDSIHNIIKNKLIENSNDFIIKNDSNIIIGKIDKKIKSEEQLQYTIFQVISKNNKEIDEISCDKIEEIKNNKNYTIKVNREINYSKLNNILKEKLITKNDYVLIKNDKNLNYLILCEIKYDKKYFENFNINQKVDYLVEKIDNNFVKKKSKEFNLKIVN